MKWALFECDKCGCKQLYPYGYNGIPRGWVEVGDKVYCPSCNPFNNMKREVEEE